jgi:hypothetical protein
VQVAFEITDQETGQPYIQVGEWSLSLHNWFVENGLLKSQAIAPHARTTVSVRHQALLTWTKPICTTANSQ